MVPTGCRKKSKEKWPSSLALWQMCIFYTVILSGWIFFTRVVENDSSAASFDTILEEAVVQSPGLVENLTSELTPLSLPDEQLPQELETEIASNVSEPKTQEGKPPAPPEQKPQHDQIKVAEPAAPSDSKVHELGHEGKNASHDDIPSFSEWAKKQMAEVGKNKGENLTVGTMKVRVKNYASPDCGAKVLAANPEAGNPNAILSPSRDDYMLNPCNVKIWFIVELCESIQPQRFEIANFELFSSSPQDLNIFVSDRYPTRDWSLVATVQAKDERTVQTFSFPPLPNFAKIIKVEMLSHYGSEHYCPISLFKAFGTSELEVLDNVDAEDDGPTKAIIEEDETDEELSEGDRGYFLAPVKAAVMHVVQKAAEVLVVKGGKRNNTCSNDTLSNTCFTPSYAVVCTNCSEQFYDRLFDVMCCQGEKLKTLLLNPFINNIIVNTSICSSYGFSWFNETSSNRSSARDFLGVSYIKSFLNEETIVALCNYLAVTKKKTPLNVSQDKLPEVVPLVQTTLNEPQPLEVEVDHQEDSDFTTSSFIHPTKTLSEENTTAPELKSNQTVISDEVPAANDTGKNEDLSSFQSVEATPPLDVEHIQKSSEERNNTGQVNVTAQDSVLQPAPSQDETVTADSLALDSLFPELEEEQTQDLEASTAKATMNLKVQKESVFVRLANRIKALEVNMSLSSQYLEELSRRYKRQVEELQRSLSNMMEEIRLSAERENNLANELKTVSAKVEQLTATLDKLLEDRDEWGPKAYFYGQHGMIIAFEVVMLFLCIAFCKWLTAGNGRSIEDNKNKKQPVPQRRHSTNIVVAGPPVKQRRPSEEAFVPSSSTHEELLIDGSQRKISRDQMKKKKKKKKDRPDEIDIITISSNDEETAQLGVNACTKSCCAAGLTRQQRSSAQTQTSSQETLSSLQQPMPVSLNSSIKKKTGAFKKIVKKLF
ncbi:SUN domain-containing ossification factor isoform X2 [Cimex lectularius]|uniref:SUN domain-containing protein n=1 Tax=Cimex lectularius TaxID=79782 RepID=A0A8I6TFX7_CIMLE|nr:SUN domain-containing ossification factor isoform X2 [Cimex lectularius]XP_014253365.1 SUN domain-containing ossification factor isoform X2 [Cimex lectularius]